MSLMTLDEYQTRIASYSEAIGRRERAVLFVVLPLVFGGAALVMLAGFALPRAPFLRVALAWLVAITAAAVWTVLRAWRGDRRLGTIAPCAGCGRDLVAQADAVLPSGVCPFCRAQVLGAT